MMSFILPAFPPTSAYLSRNMLIEFCCCWPYAAHLPEDGIRTPMATSASAGIATAVSVEATTAMPIVFLLIMHVSFELDCGRLTSRLRFKRHFRQLRFSNCRLMEVASCVSKSIMACRQDPARAGGAVDGP